MIDESCMLSVQHSRLIIMAAYGLMLGHIDVERSKKNISRGDRGMEAWHCICGRLALASSLQDFSTFDSVSARLGLDQMGFRRTSCSVNLNLHFDIN
jgi:hypothetical protein